MCCAVGSQRLGPIMRRAACACVRIAPPRPLLHKVLPKLNASSLHHAVSDCRCVMATRRTHHRLSNLLHSCCLLSTKHRFFADASLAGRSLELSSCNSAQYPASGDSVVTVLSAASETQAVDSAAGWTYVGSDDGEKHSSEAGAAWQSAISDYWTEVEHRQQLNVHN